MVDFNRWKLTTDKKLWMVHLKLSIYEAYYLRNI